MGLAGEGSQGTPSQTHGPNGSEIEPDSFFGMSILDAAKKFLAMKKKPQTTADVATALEQGGMTHSSGNWGNTVGSVLNRSDASGGEIVKVKRGIWGLAAWYPGRKRNTGEKKDDGEKTENNSELND